MRQEEMAMKTMGLTSKGLVRMSIGQNGKHFGLRTGMALLKVYAGLIKYLWRMKAKWQIACILAVSLSGGAPLACEAQDIWIVARYVGDRITGECPEVAGAPHNEYREHIVIYDSTLSLSVGCALGGPRMYQSFSGVYRINAYWLGDLTTPPPVEKIKLKIDEEATAVALMGWARATSLNISAYANCPSCYAIDRRRSSKQVVYELPWGYVYQEDGGYWEAEVEIPMELAVTTPEPPFAGGATVVITMEPLTKFILIHSSRDPTYRKGYDSSGNVIREPNPLGEGDTVLDERFCLFPPIGLGSNILYVVDLYPSRAAWHEAVPCNPLIDWSYALGAKGTVDYFPCLIAMSVDHDFCFDAPKLPFTDSMEAKARDQEDGFEDSATYVMRLHNEIEKDKLLRRREFDWSEGAVIASMKNTTPRDITWTVTVTRSSSFTWGTQITGGYTVSDKALGLEFGVEVSHSTSETFSCGLETGVQVTLHPNELGIFLVRPVGYREEWLCDVYNKQGFVGQTTVCHSTHPSALPNFQPEVFSRYNSTLEAFEQEMAARRAQLWCATQMSTPTLCGR
jgi:hypothetical protein